MKTGTYNYCKNDTKSFRNFFFFPIQYIYHTNQNKEIKKKGTTKKSASQNET